MQNYLLLTKQGNIPCHFFLFNMNHLQVTRNLNVLIFSYYELLCCLQPETGQTGFQWHASHHVLKHFPSLS